MTNDIFWKFYQLHFHFIALPFFPINQIGIFACDAEADGLVAFDSRMIITKHTKGNLLSTQFPLCIIDGETQHPLAIAHTSFRIVHDDEAESDDTFIL